MFVRKALTGVIIQQVERRYPRKADSSDEKFASGVKWRMIHQLIRYLVIKAVRRVTAISVENRWGSTEGRLRAQYRKQER